MKVVLIMLAGAVLLVIVPNLLMNQKTELNENEVMIRINDQEIIVEISDKPEEQSLGLSYRPSLEEKRGMLFVFPQPTMAGFWMRGMNFPLDFIWIDENLKIIEITENISPDTYPEIFSPSSPIMYVLEVNAGWVAKNKIRTGDELEF